MCMQDHLCLAGTQLALHIGCLPLVLLGSSCGCPDLLLQRMLGSRSCMTVQQHAILTSLQNERAHVTFSKCHAMCQSLEQRTSDGNLGHFRSTWHMVTVCKTIRTNLAMARWGAPRCIVMMSQPMAAASCTDAQHMKGEQHHSQAFRLKAALQKIRHITMRIAQSEDTA